MIYIDIHGHVNFPDFDADREDAIKRAKDAGVAMITVGTDMKSSVSAVELASIHENMWATVGVHPTDSKEAVDWDQLERLAGHPKVVAIGECGLDYFHSKEEDIPRQKDIFEKHIALANKLNKPLMLHVRNGKIGGKGITGNAYQDALAMIQKSAKVRSNFHFFAGTMQDMKDIIANNGTVSFTGVLTFTSDYDELVKSVPPTHIMSETDCPFVPPVPYRGKRNEPVYVIETVKAIARIRGESETAVAGQLMENARNFFGLK